MLIAIDAGHGMTTAGKRTPMFTDGTVSSETGKSFMHENEFNRATAKRLSDELNRCGVETIFVSDMTGKIDTPLRERTSRANMSKADLFVSVHANAYKGIWGSHGGVDTFHYNKDAGEGIRLAKTVQKHLAKDTKLRDRGYKAADFYVLRQTNMPAILCECGFMDSLTDAKLLLQDDYRRKVAKAICQGICEYTGRTYVEVDEKKLDRYDTIDQVPNWARPTIQKLVEKKLLLGDTKGNLTLSDDMTRVLVILDRAKVFD